MTDRFRAAMTRGPLLLDAAMGTRLVGEQGLRLADDDPALWNLSVPEVIAAIHRRDIAAGAEVLLTNTFGANRNWLSRFGRADEFATINRRAVELARREAGTNGFVVGSISPMAAEAPRSYREQAEVLVDAGVDGLLFETHRLDQAEVALGEVAPSSSVPLLVSLFAWPESPREAVCRLADRGASAVGLNCVVGMKSALRIAESLRQVTGLPLIVKPSVGFPGEVMASPASFAREAAALLALAPVMVGGCCGSNESHVAALRAAWYHGGTGR
ncbi:Methionine synthase I (cobalamin-dependent), methyltransferase domain [Singulisphaera sp. GP187]|uniref:homocysteine S-methyltransferase family protein n=1 Tax=Singulisphaera sp. GP187 TaxID=1882752 RepID=UPI0009263B2E|nr:homocysteine S-methyltransferase family protein [Singulisphaera sp. GP187]SIO08516.1 Methionine synthase I (cobalamin-dependent), methyltransferase domain [Singulisphaera sp. GP187]